MNTQPVEPDGFKKADETLKNGYVGEYKEVCPYFEGKDLETSLGSI